MFFMNKKEKMKTVINFFRKKYFKNISKHPNNYNKEPFRVLISTILSQRTREENTAKASEALFSRIKTPQELVKLDNRTVERLIKSSGFYRQKSKTVKRVSRILVKDFNGKVPSERNKLASLPGVGLKTADVVLSHSFGEPVIAVDVHVNVCSKRLGLVKDDADYETTRKTLEGLTPLKDREFVNLGFVFFGREICLTAYPKCKICPFNKFCEYYKNS